jgi:hypothetical protein
MDGYFFYGCCTAIHHSIENGKMLFFPSLTMTMDQ